MDENPPSPFWLKVGGVLFAIYLVAGLIGSLAVEGGVRRETVGGVVAHSLAAVFMGAAWAVIFRPELEQRKLSIRSLFVLVTMQAFGLWLVRITSNMGMPR